MASRIVNAVRARLFGGTPNDWQTYHSVIESYLRPGMTVLDVGCGKGRIAPFPWEKYPAVSLVGMDPDPAAAQNPHLARFVHTPDPAGAWGVGEKAYDLVLARYVLEHVEEPAGFFTNVTTALRPGGRLIFLTPNARHPAVKVSRVLSHRAKTGILGRTQKLASDDIFPTHYRCNTVQALAAQAKQYGMQVERLAGAEFQSVRYLDFSLPTFLPALAYYAAIRPLPALDRRYGSAIIGVFAAPQGSDVVGGRRA